MENNPTPYQRQRRADRFASAAEPGAPQAINPSAGVAVPEAQSGRPSAYAAPEQAFRQTSQPAADVYAQSCSPQSAPYAAAPAAPAYPNAHPAQPVQGVQAAAPIQPAQGLKSAHPQAPTGNRPPRSLQQGQAAAGGWSMPVAQPRARQEYPSASPASTYRKAPVAERPHAVGNGRRVPAQEAATAEHSRRRTGRDAIPGEQNTPSRQAVQKRKTPAWLLTLLSLTLILVMALIAFDFLMQAYLKTAADEKQAAYQSILTNYHVTEQADGRLRVTWQDTIEHYAEQYNLEPAFVTAVIRCESSFRTHAESSVGARGLMQLMPDTAKWVAGKLNDPYDFDRLYDAETSIRYGCWYLNYLSELFRGDPVLVAAAYHAGQGEVWGWLGDPAISPDGVHVPIENIPISNTKTYAGRVTQAYGIYQTLLYPDDVSAGSAAAVRTAAVR